MPTENIEQPTNTFGGLFDISPWLMFILLNFIYIVSLYVQNTYILTDEVYYNSLGEQLTTERIKEWLNVQKGYTWIQYASVPVLIIFQTFMVTMCLNIGALLDDVKVGFGKLFGLVLKASIVFGFGRLLFSIFGLFADITTMDDIANVNYFSILSLMGAESLPKWSLYIFQTLNVFEVGFITLLVLGINKLMPIPLEKRINFVFLTYGIGLVCWVLLITYLMISFMPT